jgi:hypothetical protein
MLSLRSPTNRRLTSADLRKISSISSLETYAMRPIFRSLTLATFSVMLSLASPTFAADTPSTLNPSPKTGACDLLDAAQLASAGFTLSGRPRGNTFEVTTEQSGAPSEIHADICFFYDGIEGGRRSVNVTVETFARMDGVAQWLAGKNQKTTSDGAALSQHGAITCESGLYDYVSANTDNRNDKQQQRYLACDTLHAAHHIIVGFDVPADDAKLPSTAQVTSLLERVIARLTKHGQ